MIPTHEEIQEIVNLRENKDKKYLELVEELYSKYGTFSVQIKLPRKDEKNYFRLILLTDDRYEKGYRINISKLIKEAKNSKLLKPNNAVKFMMED